MGRVFTVLSAILLMVFASCGPSDDGIYVPDGSFPDADDETDGGDADGVDAGCQFDSQCDDGIDCTEDLCDRQTGLCDYIPDHDSCQDSSRCNGVETCDPRTGCEPGIPYPRCNDGLPCTIDICIEPDDPQARPTCEHRNMDRDNDGHVDSHCPADYEDPEGPSGDDCADLDANRFPGAPEFCFDRLDNNCDGLVDENDPECQLVNDDCDGALALLPGMIREGFTTDADADEEISCGFSSDRDVVYEFTLDSAADVTINAWGHDFFFPTFAVQGTCGEVDSELGCESGGGEVSFYGCAMEQGTYSVIVQSWEEGVFDLLLTVEEPSEPPANDGCDGAAMVTETGTFSGTLKCATEDFEPSCGYWDVHDTVYQLSLDRARDVELTLTTNSSDWVSLSMHSACGADAELMCVRGTEPNRLLRNLERGDYWVVVSADTQLDYELTATFGEPSPPPDGEDCSTTRILEDGAPAQVSLGDFVGGVPISCSANENHHDVVFEFELEEPRNVRLDLTSSGTQPYFALRDECDNAATEHFCGWGTAQSRAVCAMERGSYYVIVRADRPAEIEMTLTTSDAGTLVENDSCVTPEDVSGGGVFPGTLLCSTRHHDVACDFRDQYDVVYTFTLEETQDVEISVQPDVERNISFSLRRDCWESIGEYACLTGTDPARLFRSVAAGTYYIVVAGEYAVDFDLAMTLSPPTTSCNGIERIDASTVVTGNTSAEADDFRSTCGGGGAGPDIPYLLEIPYPFDLAAEVVSGSFDTVLHLRSLCDDPTSQVACDDDDGEGSLSALSPTGLEAGSYVLVMDGYDARDFGEYSLDIGITPAPIDPCVEASTVTASGALTGNTCGITPTGDEGSCGGDEDREHAYLIEITADSSFVAEVTTTDFDMVMYLREECASSATEITCDTGESGDPRIETTLTPGTYALFIDGEGQSCGDYDVAVTISAL